MKQRNLKTVLARLAVLFALVLLAGLTLVGCGGNKGNQNNGATEEPKEEPLIFDECLELTEATTWDDTTKKTIDELKDFARYKIITFTAKKDFTFSNFMYSYKGQIETGESFDMMTNELWGSSGSREIETPKAINSNTVFSIGSTEKIENWYCRTYSSELLISLSTSPSTTTETKMQVKAGEKITLNFGQIIYRKATTFTNYNVSMSFYNFILK